MLIDVSSIRKYDGASKPISVSLDISEFFPDFSDVVASGEIKNFAGVVSFKLTATAKYKAVCDRCGADTILDIEAKIDAVIDEDGTKDDSVLFTDGKINLDKTVADALVLAIPMTILCSEDCPGLSGEGFEVLSEEEC